MTWHRTLSWCVTLVLAVSVPLPSRAQEAPHGAPDRSRATTSDSAVPPNGIVRVEVSSRGRTLHGQLARLLTAEIDTAVALGRLPLVELGATWCGACQTLDTAMRESREMIEVLAGTYVIHLDVDDWDGAEDLRPLGLESETGGIPAVIAVDRTGHSIQQAVDMADMDQKNEVGGMAHAINRLMQTQRSGRHAVDAPAAEVTATKDR